MPSTTGTAMAAACPLLWCPPELEAALLGVTADSVDVATMVAPVPAVTNDCLAALLQSERKCEARKCLPGPVG